MLKSAIMVSSVFVAALVFAENRKDIPYSDQSERNVLDLYLPEGLDSPMVILSIHGGGFKFGDKDDQSPRKNAASQVLLDAGFAIASMNYRLSNQATYPAQVDDVKAAIEYLRAHQDELGINADQMGAMGGSAGGYLATMAGVALASDEATRISAVVDGFGPILFNEMDNDMNATGLTPKNGPTLSADSPESALLGVDLSKQPDAAIAASPLSFIAENAENIPPFLILHGNQDNFISYKQSERLLAALQENGVSAEMILVDGAGHGPGVFEGEQNLAVVEFFKTNLK